MFTHTHTNTLPHKHAQLTAAMEPQSVWPNYGSYHSEIVQGKFTAFDLQFYMCLHFYSERISLFSSLTNACIKLQSWNEP